VNQGEAIPLTGKAGQGTSELLYAICALAACMSWATRDLYSDIVTLLQQALTNCLVCCTHHVYMCSVQRAASTGTAEVASLVWEITSWESEAGML